MTPKKIFGKVKILDFKGDVEPQAAKVWKLKIEKIFDNMQCPESRKVPLAMFLFERETKRWWVGQ
ncbi:hypothetical protein IEQ34_015226 [Dendrobium chrysotoxum]|uniref:Uncharacterized protein n=1 Tax=Dendrobium chrysotoxum TaxID=161865 RepID=A0AAV7GHT3_DENCH|nr:hypothetical protein IEQ34_015226 [Dendrobium chrysotoxum]